MKLRERDLDPRAERELDAVERALAGKPVDPDLTDWAELTALLQEERPEPREEWSGELDELAAGRFRRDDGGGASVRTFAERLGELLPRRMAAPVGALATLAIVAVVAVSTLDRGNSDDSATSDSSTPASGETLSVEPAGEDLPPIQDLEESLQEAAPSDAASSDDAGVTLDARSASPAFQSDENKIAPGTSKRQVDRDVQLSLSARPDDVRDVSDKAIAITRGLGGIVTSSQVTEEGKRANATLQLTIPTRNLDQALDGLTELANVESLNETTLDITRPYVSAQDRLEDAEAERRELLQALGNATTDADAEALRLQIDDARREISSAEAAFENIARQARLSDVSLTIMGDPGAEAKDDDGRTIGDWLDDTVSVLRDVAGILLISAAILVPLTILATITWFVISRTRRRRRERALDA